MKVGIALPSMVPGLTREQLLGWMRAADAGPFSLLGAGERIAYGNQEMMALLAAAAAVTERVGLMATVSVLPMHSAVYVAKQAATIDVLSAGRFTLGVGVGGREHDYRALGAPFSGRHLRLDANVAIVKRVWAGDEPVEGVAAVGPSPVQPGGPRLLAGVMGAKAMARAAQWADGLAGFDMAADADAIALSCAAFGGAWRAAGRAGAPFLQSSAWFGLGDQASETVAQYAFDYLRIFGDDGAHALAAMQRLTSASAVRDALQAIADTGLDEFVLVATSADVDDLHRAADIVTSLGVH